MVSNLIGKKTKICPLLETEHLFLLGILKRIVVIEMFLTNKQLLQLLISKISLKI